jgi:hypothetical protein
LLKLYFATHLPEALTARFDELLSKADVFAMEYAYNDEAQTVEQYWNAVSKGEVIHRASALSS